MVFCENCERIKNNNIWSPLPLFLSLTAFVEAGTLTRSRFRRNAGTIASSVPEIADFLEGKLNLGSMSWAQINQVVKGVVSQSDYVGEDLDEVKDEFESHALAYVATVVVLTLLALVALLLVAFNSMRLRHLFGKIKNGPPSNLEVIRKNPQEFARIRKMDVADINLEGHQSPPFYAPPALPYYGPRAPPHFNHDPSLETTPFPGNPVRHSQQSSTQAPASTPTVSS